MNVPKLAKQTLIKFVVIIRHGNERGSLSFPHSCPQLQRSPRPFPRLELRRQVSDIDKFVYDDIILHDYHPHPKIHMDMAV